MRFSMHFYKYNFFFILLFIYRLYISYTGLCKRIHIHVFLLEIISEREYSCKNSYFGLDVLIPIWAKSRNSPFLCIWCKIICFIKENIRPYLIRASFSHIGTFRPMFENNTPNLPSVERKCVFCLM